MPFYVRDADRARVAKALRAIRSIPGLVRRNLLLIIFAAMLGAQWMTLFALQDIYREIRTIRYRGPDCDQYNPCHVYFEERRR
jgi:hypothetical protein